MTTPDRNKDLPQSHPRKFSRRFVLGLGARLGLAAVAAPAMLTLEPMLRPFVDQKGKVVAEEKKPVLGRLPRNLSWVEPFVLDPSKPVEEEEKRRQILEAELNSSHPQAVTILRYMTGSGHSELTRIAYAIATKTAGEVENNDGFTKKFQLRLNSTMDEKQLSKEGKFGAAVGKNILKPTQLDFGLFFVVANADRLSPEHIEPVIQLCAEWYFLEEAWKVQGANVDELDQLIKSMEFELRRRAAAKTSSLAKEILGLVQEWGFKGVATQDPDSLSEEGSIPAGVPEEAQSSYGTSAEEASP